jgi:hypothetical protein
MAAMVLLVNGEPYVVESGSEEAAVMARVEEAFRGGGGWVDVGNSAFFMTPSTQVSMVPSRSLGSRASL